MNRDQLFKLMLFAIALAMVIEISFFMRQAKAQVIVIDPTSGSVKDIVIMPLSPPQR